MKKLILIIACLATAVSLAQDSFVNNNYTYDLNHYGIKGEVEYIVTTNWRAIQSKGEIKKGKPTWSGWSHATIDYFDKSGILIKREELDIHDEIIIRYNYHKNKDGKIVEENILWRGNEDLGRKDEFQTIINQYDKKSRLTERITYYANDENIQFRDIFIYDKNGLISETMNCSSHPICIHEVYEINESENSVLIKNLKTNYSSFYNYDSSGNWIKYTYYANGIINGQTERVFDTKGNLSETTSYDFKDRSKSLSSKFNYTHDQYNNITKEIRISFNKSGVKSYVEKKFKYKYDHKGNWIERIEYENNSPIKIRSRVINYFN